MILSKNHFLVYNYNYIFNKEFDHLNRNFCDLFWGGLILALIIIPFTLLSYLGGYIANKFFNWRRSASYTTSHFFWVTLGRISLNIMLYTLLFIYFQYVIKVGLFTGLIRPVILILLVVLIVIIFIIMGAGVGYLYDTCKAKIELKKLSQSLPPKKDNILVTWFKAFKEKHCPIIEFKD